MSVLRLYDPDAVGPDGYPPEWHRGLGFDLNLGIKHLVREEAGTRCVRCGHPYTGGGEWSPCDGRCSHTGPMRVWTRLGGGDEGWSDFDPTPGACGAAVDAVAPAAVEARWRILTVHHLNGVKYDCRWWNLAALCQRCHLTIQGKVLMERVWPWEHSEWFKVYVAGYYAFVYEGRDIDRAEAEERIDELLAHERVA